jgi:hypothetical protein
MPDIIDELLKRAQEMARDKAGHAKWSEDMRLLEQAAKEIDGLRKQIEQLVRGEWPTRG